MSWFCYLMRLELFLLNSMEYLLRFFQFLARDKPTVNHMPYIKKLLHYESVKSYDLGRWHHRPSGYPWIQSCRTICWRYIQIKQNIFNRSWKRATFREVFKAVFSLKSKLFKYADGVLPVPYIKKNNIRLQFNCKWLYQADCNQWYILRRV